MLLSSLKVYAIVPNNYYLSLAKIPFRIYLKQPIILLPTLCICLNFLLKLLFLINMFAGTNLFSQQPQPSTNKMFGNTNQNKSFGFGFMPSQSVLFAQQPQQPTESSFFQSNRSMSFGNNFFESETTGTVIKFTPVTDTYTMQSNGTTQLINTKYHSITLMKEYKNKSFEELRFEDYSTNRKGPQQTSFQNTSFTVLPTTIFSILRQTDNKPVFGQTPVFGSFNPTSPPNFFKESYTFGVPPSIPGLDFNLTLASKLFDSNQTHRPPFQSLFGTAATQVQSTFGTEQFGQTNTQVNQLYFILGLFYTKCFRIQRLIFLKN